MRELREQCNVLGFPNRFNQQCQTNPNLSYRNNQFTQSNTQWRLDAQPPKTYQAPSSNTLQQSFPLEDAFRSFMEFDWSKKCMIITIYLLVFRINKGFSRCVNALIILRCYVRFHLLFLCIFQVL